MTDIICINLAFKVPSDKVSEVQSIFKKHALWMKAFYSESNKGQKYLVNVYFTKAKEYKDPTDPTKGETGNVLFTINERFTSELSVKRHNDNVKQNEYFEKFADIKNKFAVFRSANGEMYHSIR